MIRLKSIDKVMKILEVEINNNIVEDLGSFEYNLLCQIMEDLETLTNTIIERRHDE